MESCRQRIVDAMVDTPDGKARFEQYGERINRAIVARGPQEASAAPSPADNRSLSADTTRPAAPTRHVTFDTRVESHDTAPSAALTLP